MGIASVLAFGLGASFGMLPRACDVCRGVVWRVSAGCAAHAWEGSAGVGEWGVREH